MESPEDQANPYAPPTSDGSMESLPMAVPANVDLGFVQDFRSQMHALGGFWIVLGAIPSAIVAVSAGNPRDRFETFGLVLLMIVGLAWVTCGIFTIMKNLSAVYIGLVLTYLTFCVSLLSMNLCGIIILLVAILQAHRVIKWARIMRTHGIPLTTKVS